MPLHPSFPDFSIIVLRSLYIEVQDFLAATATVTFAPGETEKCQPFGIVDDDVVEELLEDFMVEIDEVSPDAVKIGENSTTTVMIMDNDGKYKYNRIWQKIDYTYVEF